MGLGRFCKGETDDGDNNRAFAKTFVGDCVMVDIRERLREKQPEISLPENAMELLNAPAVVAPKISSDIETNARLTLLKMFQSTKLEEHFTFKTIRYGGKSHIQAMRTQLGKVRKEAKEEGRTITQFKLLVVAIEQYPTHDLVTVVRSKLSSLRTKNLYGELVSLMSETDQETGESTSDDNSVEGAE